MRIITFNVNGIRSAARKGLFGWLARQNADVVCLQEVKAQGVQAVVNWSVEPAQSIIPKNMKQIEFNVPLFQSHGVANQTFIQQAEGAAEGVIFPAGRLLIADRLPDSDPQKPVLVGYARVSTFEQTLALQQDALTSAGCERLFTDTASGARIIIPPPDRPVEH